MSTKNSKPLTYVEARREARRLLGDHAELQEMPQVPVYKFVVGYMKSGKFYPLGAGMNWAEAIQHLKDRIEKSKS